MWNPFRRKKSPPPVSRLPSLTLVVDPETANVSSSCHLGDPLSVEEAMANGKAVGYLAFLASEGRFLALMQQAIAVAGTGERMEAVSNQALGQINALLREKGIQERQDGPLVHPTQALDPRAQGGPFHG